MAVAVAAVRATPPTIADVVLNALRAEREAESQTDSYDLRAYVCRENETFVANNQQLVSPSVIVRLRHPLAAAAGTMPSVAVVHCDVLLAAREMLAPGHSVGVLNFASERSPGGGYWDGSRAQEEELCRRLVTLYASLRNTSYPLEGGLVVSTNLWERRRSGDYGWLATPCGPYTVVSAALPNISRRRARTDYAEVVGKQVRQVLHTFASMGCDRIVLGAWGCGSYGGNAAIVAQAFATHLRGDLGQCFDMVLFAIVGPDRSTPPHVYHTFATGLQDILSLPQEQPGTTTAKGTGRGCSQRRSRSGGWRRRLDPANRTRGPTS